MEREHETEEYEEQMAPWITGQIATLSRQSNGIDTRWGYQTIFLQDFIEQKFCKRIAKKLDESKNNAII